MVSWNKILLFDFRKISAAKNKSKSFQLAIIHTVDTEILFQNDSTQIPLIHWESGFFQIFKNILTEFSGCRKIGYDIIFNIDGSASIGEDDFEKIKRWGFIWTWLTLNDTRPWVEAFVWPSYLKMANLIW